MDGNMWNGKWQPNPTELAVQQMTALGNEIHGLSQVIMANNSYMMNAVQSEIAKAERERRKERRKAIQSYVAVAEGHFGLLEVYDDGTKKITDLALNLVPDFKICIFEMKGVKESGHYFGIYAMANDFWIIGKKEKISGKGLWESFIKNGIRFNSQIPKSKIKAALYEYFMPKIWEAETKQIPAFSGWFEREFWSAENFLFKENEGLNDLPIRKKFFYGYKDSKLLVEEYFEGIRKIADWRNRVWSMISPIGGMFSSLLSEAGITLEKYLNFVNFSDMSVRGLRRYLQVFNRGRRAEEKVSVENILQMKDEVIFLDACGRGESDYKKKQKREICQKIAESVVDGEMITEDGFMVSGPVVIISDRIIREKCAINIFVDKDFYRRDNDEERNVFAQDTIGVVFVNMVKYFENNFDEFERILAEAENIETKKKWLFCAYRICQNFWKSVGINMQEMADLPEFVDFQELLQDNLSFEDDLTSDFVKIIRREAKNWVIIPKSQGKGSGNEIVYTDAFIWLPVKVFKAMLSNYGILDQRYQFLEELREKNYLVPDHQDISRKVQVAGKRYEAYQFQRDLFYIPGTVDIVELGKEDENV